VTDDATRHNQAAYDRIAGLYAERHADLSRSSGIWCCAALLHVPQDETMTVLREMRRVLRQDGHVALITALGPGTQARTGTVRPAHEALVLLPGPRRTG
jgi:hypothetical protein